MSDNYAHMCRDDHPQIGHNVSDDDERCPVCRERDRADYIKDAASALVERMEAIYEDPAFKSVWAINQLHVGPYVGPKWEAEFSALKNALATS